jgi:hypothetical protein
MLRLLKKVHLTDSDTAKRTKPPPVLHDYKLSNSQEGGQNSVAHPTWLLSPPLGGGSRSEAEAGGGAFRHTKKTAPPFSRKGGF